MRAIKPSSLTQELKANALAGIPSMIWGPPGIGKSDVVYQFGTELDAKIFELRANLFDPVDVRGGLKVVEQADGSYRTRYGVPEDYPDSDYQGTVVLFIEELPNASKATMNSLLQLILNGRIGTYQLPPNTIIVAAGNRAIDRAAVNEMPTPVKNRFAHYTLEPNIDDWVSWAVQNNVDPSITSFLRYRPTLLHNMDAKDNAFPTPRSWWMLNRKLPFVDKQDMFFSVAAVIGDGAAGEYIAHRAIYNDVPDIDDLLANPGTIAVPREASILYAIAGAFAAHVTEDNFASIMRFTRRMPPEYQVIVVRDCLARERKLAGSDVFKTWTAQNADVLL
jgi:hypothetical protein